MDDTPKTDLDLVQDVLGIKLPVERTAENLAAFADVLAEIEKFRALDLRDVHPAVIFRPLSTTSDEGR